PDAGRFYVLREGRASNPRSCSNPVFACRLEEDGSSSGGEEANPLPFSRRGRTVLAGDGTRRGASWCRPVLQAREEVPGAEIRELDDLVQVEAPVVVQLFDSAIPNHPDEVQATEPAQLVAQERGGDVAVRPLQREVAQVLLFGPG